MTDDEDKFFLASFLEGFMGQLVIWNKWCVACMFEMIQAIKIQKPWGMQKTEGTMMGTFKI